LFQWNHQQLVTHETIEQHLLQAGQIHAHAALLSLSKEASPHPIADLASGICLLARLRRLSASIETAYRLLQEQVLSLFPRDDLEAEEELITLTEEEIEARQEQRQAARAHVHQCVLRCIEDARSLSTTTPVSRAELLAHLAELSAIGSLRGEEVADGFACKFGVSPLQAQASALLSIQARELHLPTSLLHQELLALDQPWQALSPRITEHLMTTLTLPLPSHFWHHAFSS
jgi:hypothetical protein